MFVQEKFADAVISGGAHWFFTSYALANDGIPGTWTYNDGQTTDNTWLQYRFTVPWTSIQDVKGFEIEAYLNPGIDENGGIGSVVICASGKKASLEFALGKASVTPSGTITRVILSTDTIGVPNVNTLHPIILGNSTELFGTTWIPDELSDIRILVRKPSQLSDEDNTTGVYRSIEYLKLRVYSSTQVLNMHLTGQGYSTGVVDLDWDN